jgi:hypothetical protein
VVAIQTYGTEQEHLARKNLQTPVSFIGSYKMIMPLARGPASSTLARITKYAGAALLLLLFWVFVTLTFYGLVYGSIILAVVWIVFTLQRRHHIRAARRVLADQAHEPPRAIPQLTP